MKKNKNANLPFNMAYIDIPQGNIKNILYGNDNDYLTVVNFVLDFKEEKVIYGVYNFNYNNVNIELKVVKINKEDENPIMQSANKIFSILQMHDNSIKDIPVSAFTDNRNIYPCTLISVKFPYRLSKRIDQNNENGFLMEDFDPEDLEVAGFPPSKEKVEALKVVNYFLKSSQVLGFKKSLIYTDVTMFTEVYYKKGIRHPLYMRFHALSSNSAFREVLKDYYLDGFNQEELNKSINDVVSFKKFDSSTIKDESKLLDAVMFVIDNVLIHHIENRRWIDAFWDGSRTIKHEGKEINVPRIPKHEPNIQPTLHVILDMALTPLGIHVTRETDEGIGLLDFKCLFTTQKGLPISVGIEFKLAHHSEIRKGITKQLPAYLKSIKSGSGIFFIMWFKDKDGKIFNKPKKHEKENFKSWLKQEAINTSKETQKVIISSVIDVSIRPSASNIK